jgi:hypothetical protein
LIAECDLQVVQRHTVTMPIKDRHERTKEVRKMETGLTREQGNKFHGEAKPDPLKPVPDSFPSGTHLPV